MFFGCTVRSTCYTSIHNLIGQAAMADGHWMPLGRGNGYAYTDGTSYMFRRDGFSSIIFATRADANKLGWRYYRQWLASHQQQQKGAGPCPTLQRASPAAAAHQLSPVTVGQKRTASELGDAPNSADVHCAQLDQQQKRLKRIPLAVNAAGHAAASEAASPDAARSKKKQKNATRAAAGAAVQQRRRRCSAPAAGLQTPATAAAAGRESAGSNRPSTAVSAAPAAVVAVGAAAECFPTTMSIWLPGSKNSSTPTYSSKQLQLHVGCSLGRGGFGEVHKVAVKARGPNSLAALKRRGTAGVALRRLLAGKGPGSEGGSNSVTMALKLAPPFQSTSSEVQLNHKHDSALYLQQARQRMFAEFRLMTACAASPHIVDAFAAGSIVAADGAAALPAILMEFAELGDVQQALVEGHHAPADDLQRQLRFSGIAPQPQQHGAQGSSQQLQPQQEQQQQEARGLSSVASQRVVRAAALALQDLHDMTGHMHCDMKTNNLLVFGSAADPTIKLCDLGVAKLRTEAPQFGPVSGTKDWQAPEQASPAAGRLDFCLDSWGLGLLLLSLRLGKPPFWWLLECGVRPADWAATLAADFCSPDSPYFQAGEAQPEAALGALETAFVQRCMASSSERPSPCQMLREDPYLSSSYRGG